MRHLCITLSTTLALAAGCSDPAEGPAPQEVISRVTLHFAPNGTVSGPDAVTAVADDPDGDGGAPPVIDPIVLVAATSYVLTVTFENALEEPPEDITLEVRDEGDEHQVFVTGTAVNGPATDHPNAPLTHGYVDEDTNGLPLGLEHAIMTGAAGSGELTITLRHLPPLNGVPTKTADLADQVKAAGGFAGVAGESDVAVTFAVSVP